MNTLTEPLSQEGKSLTGKQVLVVDDDKALLLALTKVLRNEGAVVLPAGDASEAIRFLSLNFGQIDLVLTDMRMPNASGKCVLSAVRGAYHNVPVIVITAFATDAIREACTALGAFAFLEKPVNTSTLLGEVRRAVGHAAGPKPS